MELQEALLKRRSVRKFTNEPVSDNDIDSLLKAAMSGPSAMNMKPWDFYVITNPETLDKVRSTSRYANMNAPLAIIVCGTKNAIDPFGIGEFWVQDCSAATENILLCATDLGLGAVWCGVYPKDNAVNSVREAIGLKKDKLPLNIIYVGHPAETPEPRTQYSEKNVHRI